MDLPVDPLPVAAPLDPLVDQLEQVFLVACLLLDPACLLEVWFPPAAPARCVITNGLSEVTAPAIWLPTLLRGKLQ